MAKTFCRYAEAAGVTKFKQVTPHTHLDSTQRYTRNHPHQLRGAVKRLRWTDHPPGADTVG